MKRYIAEEGSPEVQAWIAENEGELVTSIVTYVEVLSTLARCRRERRLGATDYQALKRAFVTDWEAVQIVELMTPVMSTAEGLIDRYQLRGFDAVQLCSALWVGRPAFALL